MKWLHTKRPKHRRLMLLSLAEVRQSRKLLATPRWREPYAPSVAFRHLQRAIHHVVECGCPRDLWFDEVQDAIVEPDEA